VIDRRGERTALGGGGIPIPMGVGGGGIGLVVVVVILLLNSGVFSGGGFDVEAPPQLDPAGDAASAGEAPNGKLVGLVEFVLDDAQQFWSDTFRQAGRDYVDAHLVLFHGATESGCGGATADIGPHYCPVDQNIYIDLGFFRELRDRFGAPGDFAQAYVVAHELGHHVQNLMGISGDVERAARADPSQRNALSIRLELQADCFAGVWAFTTYQRSLLETGDLEEGLTAAAAVGDDRIQRQATGRIDPESWTHGSSEQRVRWFERGFADGDPNACDTFGADTL
jgi:predicted metalloprotease